MHTQLHWSPAMKATLKDAGDLCVNRSGVVPPWWTPLGNCSEGYLLADPSWVSLRRRTATCSDDLIPRQSAPSWPPSAQHIWHSARGGSTATAPALSQRELRSACRCLEFADGWNMNHAHLNVAKQSCKTIFMGLSENRVLYIINNIISISLHVYKYICDTLLYYILKSNGWSSCSTIVISFFRDLHIGEKSAEN